MSKNIETINEFTEFVNDFWKEQDKPFAFGIGKGIDNADGELIAVRWLTINVEENMGTAAVLLAGEGELTGYQIIEKYFSAFENDGKHHANIAALNHIGDDYPVCNFYFSEDQLLNDKPEDIPDAHFRLCLMSRRNYIPNLLELDGAFGILPNLLWTAKSAYTLEEYNQRWFEIQESGEFPITHDKFPPMYWANPALEGVRVANTLMVRNGAHLGSGTTVMHYAFINFNAGTLGKAMVEGRIGAGITIGDATDIGAGAGFLGTLSGGNDKKLSTGKQNLVGAMAECGIILGTGNQIAAGVTILANSKIYHLSEAKWKVGSDFDNCNNTLFIFNTKHGRLEARSVKNPVELNEKLHKND